MQTLLKILKNIIKGIFYIAVFLGLFILAVRFEVGSKSKSVSSSYTVNQDTKIDPNSELAKYVTQEEIDDFGFRCANIVCDEEKNATLVPLRAALDRKDTDFVVKFIKDNNRTADVSMRDKRTPLMYSSFRNDINTSNALINLGADIRAKDRFGLSPMAYAIMLNSLDTAKILLEKGVKFEEVEYVAYFILNSKEGYGRMSSLIIDGNDITINYAIDPDHPGRYPDTDINNPACVKTCDGEKVEPFKYVVSKNLPQMAELMLSMGYKPKEFKMANGLQGIKEEEKNMPLERSAWAILDDYEDYEPMLDVFIKYDLPSAPNKEQLKEAYEVCYDKLKSFTKEKEKYIYKMNQGRDEEAEEKIKRTNNKYKYAPYSLLYEDGLLQYKPKPIDPEQIKIFDNTINSYLKHCPDENATFKDIKTFIKWANERKRRYEIEVFIDKYEKNPNKVIYIDSNRSKSDQSEIYK